MTDPFTSEGAKAPPKPYTPGEGRREIRSFVLRQGRFTPAQQRAFDDAWPRFGLDYSGQPRDYAAVFGRSAPKVLEIGFGNGEALRFAARQDPSPHAPVDREARPGFRVSTGAKVALVVCGALCVVLAHPSAMAVPETQRAGYFFGAGLAAVGLPLLGGWLTHKLGSRPDAVIIVLALLCVVGRATSFLGAVSPALEAR